MKKHLIIFSALSLLSINASFGQVSFRAGLKGGINFANLENSVSSSYENRTGYHAGAFTTFKFTKFAIQPEVIFSNQGAIDKSTTLADLESEFNYINIPIIFKTYIAGGFNLQIGPQFGLLSSAKREFIDELNEVNSIKDAKKELKESDVSLAIGVGMDLPAGLTLDARYNLGLTEINNSAALGATKNQVFQVSIGYRFINIGKK